MTGSPVDCPDQDTAGTSCSISMEKLLERAVQHAELIYRVSEESKLLFDEMLISNGMNLHIPEGNMCAPKTVPVPLSKSEIQQISILGEGSLTLEGLEETSDRFVSSNILETVRRDYSVIYCFRKDAHKMQTFLKLLKCRQIDKENCSLF
ncbi:hypothetical protein cypCar_00030069 [Cyprinus carpio]|nr:hypothetical protein cypCar_00030069 [Cyprinus carpio]